MRTALRVLHLEDSPDDATLLELHLQREGYDAVVRRVETAEAFAAALDGGDIDVIIADHSLPRFDAPSALAKLQERGLDLPFIVMSGTIPQHRAIELMRAGAHDFVTKDDPGRLDPVIRRELREAANRQARRQAEAARERLVDQLQTALRAKDEFLAMLGHELRNPMAPILTALELLKARPAQEGGREIAVIERQVRHLKRLVDDLLDVAKITRGKVELKRGILEVSAIVGRAVELASALVSARRHVLEVQVPAEGLLVDADEARMVQVISNLLTNAAHYTPPGGRITVRGARVDGQVELRIRDTGVGIAKQDLDSIFELFVQGPRKLDRAEGGLGLGLALVRNLTNLHGGTVEAESEGVGKGAEFIVRLPAASNRAADAAGSATSGPDPAAASRRNRLLLVDDNVDALELLATMAEMEGYEVRTAPDGPTALSMLASSTPDAAVLDLGLPGLDGFEVARRIRQMPALEGIRLIALSGYGQPEDLARSKAAGFDRHLVKPVDFALLEKALGD